MRSLEEIRGMDKDQKDAEIAELKRLAELERVNLNHTMEVEKVRY